MRFVLLLHGARQRAGLTAKLKRNFAGNVKMTLTAGLAVVSLAALACTPYLYIYLGRECYLALNNLKADLPLKSISPPDTSTPLSISTPAPVTK